MKGELARRREARKPVILAVDDDATNLAVVRDSLAGCDYTLLVAEDGESAIERAEYAQPDLILLDIMMPGVDGFETCRRLKSRERTRDIPVIFMTALAETAHKVKGLEVGAVDYVTKPFQREELLARIAVHLLNRQLTRELRVANETLERRVDQRTTDLAIAYNELEQEVAERQAAQEALEAQAAVLEEKLEELQKTQHLLLKSERKFRAIFDQSFQLMAVLSPDGSLLEANQATLEVCGAAATLPIAKPFWDGEWLMFSADLRGKAREALSEAAAGRFVRFEADLRNGNKNRYFDFSLKPILDETGSVQQIIQEGRDITDLKKLEKELRHSQKMEAIGTLAAGIAHDFNNILTAINGFTEITLMKLDKDSPLQKNLNQVHDAGMRASNLVRQILTVARQSEQELKPVVLSEVVQDVLKLLRSTLPTTIDIRCSIADGCADGAVLADPTQLHQVLMNLGTNAFHAMRAQGGTLTVALDRLQLQPSAMLGALAELTPGPYAQLTVADTGHGMEGAVLERIFDPYFTTKKAGEGTGLGLAVVLGIVRHHGGTITVESRPGAGTTFQVLLPLTDPTLALERGDERVPEGTERLLFVDDEESLVVLGKEMLETLGYTVRTASRSREALEIFSLNPGEFDLVVTDLTMPGLTGVELAKKLRELRADVPLLLCTGYNDLRPDAHDIERLFCDVVAKPYVVRSLASAVRRAIDRGAVGVTPSK